MAYRNLDEFLTRLEQEGEISRAVLLTADDVPVSADDTAHVYVLENGVRIVSNLFGTRKRVEMALRVLSPSLIADRLAALLDLAKPGSFGAMVGYAMQLFGALRTTTNRRALQTYTTISVEEWRSHIGGLPVMATAMTGGETAAMRPVMLSWDDETAVIESSPPLNIGERIALVIGGDPAFLFAAVTPLPDLLHRSYFASWLRERPLDMLRPPNIDFDIPANAEAFAVGTVRAVDGGAANQFLDPDSVCARIAFDSIYVQAEPIYPVWSARECDAMLDMLYEIFRPVLAKLLPGVPEAQMRPFIAGVAAAYQAARSDAPQHMPEDA